MLTVIPCRAAAAALVLSLAVACSSTNGIPAVTTSPSPTAVSGPSFQAILAAARDAAYTVTYTFGEKHGRDSSSGEQTWYVRPPQERFDFSSEDGGQLTRTSLYVLLGGAFFCYKDLVQWVCVVLSSRNTALQQNEPASVNDLLVRRPELFTGTLVGTERIAGQTAYCYDVHAASIQASGFSDGRFCYSPTGIPLGLRFATQGAEVAMEATRFSTIVVDGDLMLPATPKYPGEP